MNERTDHEYTVNANTVVQGEVTDEGVVVRNFRPSLTTEFGPPLGLRYRARFELRLARTFFNEKNGLGVGVLPRLGQSGGNSAFTETFSLEGEDAPFVVPNKVNYEVTVDLSEFNARLIVFALPPTKDPRNLWVTEEEPYSVSWQTRDEVAIARAGRLTFLAGALVGLCGSSIVASLVAFVRLP